MKMRRRYALGMDRHGGRCYHFPALRASEWTGTEADATIFGIDGHTGLRLEPRVVKIRRRYALLNGPARRPMLPILDRIFFRTHKSCSISSKMTFRQLN